MCVCLERHSRSIATSLDNTYMTCTTCRQRTCCSLKYQNNSCWFCVCLLQISKYRARVAVYNLVVDRLSVLTVKYLDVVIAMSDLLAHDLPITLTVIAFR